MRFLLTILCMVSLSAFAQEGADPRHHIRPDSLKNVTIKHTDGTQVTGHVKIDKHLKYDQHGYVSVARDTTYFDQHWKRLNKKVKGFRK